MAKWQKFILNIDKIHTENQAVKQWIVYFSSLINSEKGLWKNASITVNSLKFRN